MKTDLATLMAVVLLLARGLYVQVTPPQPQRDSWQNLNQVAHGRSYTVMDGDGNCTIGEIKALSAQNLVVKQFFSPAKTSRWRVLTCCELAMELNLPMSFSAAALLWSDVKNRTRIGSDEAPVATMRVGRQLGGKPADVPETAIRLTRWNKTASVPKESVAKAYYLREKPVGDFTQHSALFFFDPALWPYLLHVPPKISVLLYDSESNAPIGCKKRR